MYAIKRNLKIYVCTCVMADQLYAEGNGAYFDFIRNMVNLSRIFHIQFSSEFVIGGY